MTQSIRRVFIVTVVFVAATNIAPADEELAKQTSTAMKRAVEFYARQVAAHGGYVYRYSHDLAKREGEGKTGPDTVWVQPPGTPSVGAAYLDAYERTHEANLLEAARAAGECLIQGQLRSGGWQASIEFAPDLRVKYAYRVDPPRKKRSVNTTSFDDDKSQSAMRFMIRLDKALKFQDPRVHEAIIFALDAVLKAQFPNGGWAQVFQEFPDPGKYPVKPASFPETWPRKYPGGDYWLFYTFNDNAIADTIDMLFLAARVYDDKRYEAAALKAGEFIRLAQLPEPQPAWAQQYNFDMHPAWARKFEPPAISGGESQGIIASLLRLFEETGDRKYLEPIPRAIVYLRRSILSDGRLARFYELQTNKPLYLTTTYELTYEDSDLPTHYGFKVPSRVDILEKEYHELSRLTVPELSERRKKREQSGKSKPRDAEIRTIIAALDDRGAWVEDGRLRYHGKNDPTDRIISSETFLRNIGLLSRYLGQSSPEP